MIFSGKIGKNIFFLAIATICSKCIGFIREMLAAHYFGLSETFDIYLSLFVIPSIITSLLLYATPNIIIPKLKLSKDIEDKEYYTYFSSHFFWPYIFVLITIVILYNLCIESYIAHIKIPSNYYNLAIKIGRLFSIYIFFESFFNLLTVLYNSKEKFITPAFLHLTLQSSVIISLIIGGERYGVKAIAYGLAIGTIIEVLLFSLFFIKDRIIRYFSFKLSYTHNIFSSSILILLVEFIGQLYSFLDRIFLSDLPSGYITGLYYANLLKELPFVIIGVTAGGVLLPRLTRMFQTKEYSLLFKTTNNFLCIFFIIALGITLIYIIAGEKIIHILFERGQFDNSDTILTSKLLLLYVIGLPFIFLHFLLMKLYYILGKQKIVFFIAVISISIKYISNLIFINYKFYEGLALSTSFAFLFSALFLLSYYYFKLRLRQQY